MSFMPQASEEVVKQRLDICTTCEFKGELPVIHVDVCKACGCPLASKTKLQQSKCPKGKW